MIRRLTLLPFLLVAAAAVAQSPSEQGPAALAAMSVVLPVKVVAGQQATLAALTPGGRLAPGVPVELSSGEKLTTDASGRANFTAPSAPGVLVAQISGMPQGGTGAVALVIPPQPPARVGLMRVPGEISVRDRFAVSGYGFRGEADANRVSLGGQRALVLAASPVSLVVIPGPGAQPGPARIVVETGGAAATAPTDLVAVEVDSKTVAPKEKAMLVLRVRGTDRPQLLEVQNQSPRVVRFIHGDQQWLTTAGGANNAAEIKMEGLSPGDFSLRVRLVPAATGPPDVEAAHQYLVAASRRAPPNDVHRVEKLVHRLERRPPDVEKVSDDLGKILASQPAGEFGLLLLAARDALLNR
jgi:hypothetical protein